MFKARLSIPGVWGASVGVNICVESAFQVNKRQILHPEEKHQTAVLPEQSRICTGGFGRHVWGRFGGALG